jgi:hypothetical protein
MTETERQIAARQRLTFITDRFGAPARYAVTAMGEKYAITYLAPETKRKVGEQRQQALVEKAGYYKLQAGDIVLRAGIRERGDG